MDGFAQEPAIGLVAFSSPDDPEPSIQVDEDGRVVLLDGVARADFDIVDAFIADHGIDTAVAAEAGALDDVKFARGMSDQSKHAVPGADTTAQPRRSPA